MSAPFWAIAVVEWLTLTGVGYVGVSDCLSFPAKINVALGIPGCMASPKARLSDICFSEAI